MCHVPKRFTVLTTGLLSCPQACKGMRVNASKSKLILVLKGGVAKRWLRRKRLHSGQGYVIRFGSPASPLDIPRVVSATYLGVEVSLDNHVQRTCRLRLQMAAGIRQRLLKVLHTAGLGLRTRVLLYTSCVRSSMLYGQHAVGFTPSMLRLLDQRDSRYLRAHSRSPAHITHESTEALRRRLRVRSPAEVFLKMLQGRVLGGIRMLQAPRALERLWSPVLSLRLITAHRLSACPEPHGGLGEAYPDALSRVACGRRQCHESQVGLPAMVSGETGGGALKAASYHLHSGTGGNTSGDQQCGGSRSALEVQVDTATDGADHRRDAAFCTGFFSTREPCDASPSGFASPYGQFGQCLPEGGGTSHPSGQGPAIQAGEGTRSLILRPFRGLEQSKADLGRLRTSRSPGERRQGDEVSTSSMACVRVRQHTQAPQGCLQHPHNLCYLKFRLAGLCLDGPIDRTGGPLLGLCLCGY